MNETLPEQTWLLRVHQQLLLSNVSEWPLTALILLTLQTHTRAALSENTPSHLSAVVCGYTYSNNVQSVVTHLPDLHIFVMH